jgi:hypothetical protein
VPYDGSHEMYFVVRDPWLTIVKAGASVIKVRQRNLTLAILPG